jgi:broad specificity polyphosphatase/5'/3'-nucleotidase SurE
MLSHFNMFLLSFVFHFLPDDFRSSNIGAENTRGVRVDLVNLSYTHVSADGLTVDVLSGVNATVNSGEFLDDITEC